MSDTIEDMMPREHPGYFGYFSRHQHSEAKYQNGSRIKKVWGEPGDGTPLDTEGTVLGSVGFPDTGILYFVEWDNRPKFAVAVMAKKIGGVSSEVSGCPNQGSDGKD